MKPHQPFEVREFDGGVFVGEGNGKLFRVVQQCDDRTIAEATAALLNMAYWRGWGDGLLDQRGELFL